MDLDLKGKNVLVTGAGQGLGLAIADAFACEGANVAYHYLTSSAGAEAASSAAADAHGINTLAVKADISDEEQVRAISEEIHEALGPIDVLVNNAAFTGHMAPFVDTTLNEWRRQLDVTLIGLFLVTRQFVPDMIAAGSGAIITIAGEAGRAGEPQAAVASATRSGAIGFTRSLAKEVARHKVRANSVTVGLIDTPATRRDVIEKVSPETLTRITKNYPLRRLGEVVDVPPVILMLASSATSWVTGQTYAVNGGYVMP
jgi:2-hydroxycyclohexanecarboxyl-CoA dehydrogenase